MTETASLVENARIIARLANAQLRARQENARIIAKLSRERGKAGPSVIPRTGPPSLTSLPAGLANIEWKQRIAALRAAVERFGLADTYEGGAFFPTVPDLQSGLRGIEDTQSLDLLQLKGSLIDQVV
ncbi:MAG: hypothetical protein JRI34_07500 [Deltaproteobacteria bacterium]|nr:hypothetical protein [Deltaproteobacteria bacterium]